MPSAIIRLKVDDTSNRPPSPLSRQLWIQSSFSVLIRSEVQFTLARLDTRAVARVSGTTFPLASSQSMSIFRAVLRSHHDQSLFASISPFTGDYFHVLTGFMILHPIAAGFTGVAFIVGVLGLIFNSPIAAGFMTYLSILADSLVFIVLCFDLGLWIYVRNQIRHQELHAELGNAIWLTLTAYIINILAYLLGACSVAEIVLEDER